MTWFEDFTPGQKMRHARSSTVTDVEGHLVAKLVMNTAQAHWNEHYLAGAFSALGAGRVVFGLCTASLVFGLASQDTAETAIAELGCTGLRFLSPVKQGDTLSALTEVLSTEPAPDRDDAGIVRFKHWGVTHDERVVFEGERTVLLRKRDA